MNDLQEKRYPLTGGGGLHRCEMSRPHIFKAMGSHMALRLLTLRAGRALPLPPKKIPNTHFC
jgi:hypothetical protein